MPMFINISLASLLSLASLSSQWAIRMTNSSPGASMLCPNQIDNSCTIIGEKKRIRVELHDVARTSENFTILQKAGDEVLRTLAFAHYDYFVAVADPLVGRAV